jgi:hypothetical protein
MKTHKHSVLLVWLVILAGITSAAIWIGVPRAKSEAAADTTGSLKAAIQPTREISGTGESPAISFIDNPSPTCSRPAAGTDICYVNWNYLNVTASPGQYIISMTVMIDDKLRAYMGGFFQNSMYIPGNMLGEGFRVQCGPPGASGLINSGNTYSYAVRAKETGGLGAANYGSLTCPADILALASLTVSGPTNGLVGKVYSFNTSVLPITATLPITYTWLTTDQPVKVIVTDTQSTITYTWATEGNKSVLVSAENMNSSVSGLLEIGIITHYGLYLPLLRK